MSCLDISNNVCSWVDGYCPFIEDGLKLPTGIIFDVLRSLVRELHLDIGANQHLAKLDCFLMNIT
jgi:hypothetical protein